MHPFIVAIFAFFSLESIKAGPDIAQTLTEQEARDFIQRFIEEGKRLALQHTDVKKELSAALKKQFYEFLEPKLARQTVTFILGKKILNDVKAKGLVKEDYIQKFTPKLIGYAVMFYSSPEKIKIFKEFTYDAKTAKAELSPDRKMAKVEISFYYEGKTSVVQFYVIKENGVLKLDDLGLEGIRQTITQSGEIQAFFSDPSKGNNDAKTFLDWFTKKIDTYLAR